MPVRVHGNSVTFQMLACSVAQLCLTLDPGTIAGCNRLFMGFSRQDYCSEFPFSPPEYLLYPGIEPASPAFAGRFFMPQQPGKSTFHIQAQKCQNDKEAFTFLTFQKVRLKPKPISRSRPIKKLKENFGSSLS